MCSVKPLLCLPYYVLPLDLGIAAATAMRTPAAPAPCCDPCHVVQMSNRGDVGSSTRGFIRVDMFTSRQQIVCLHIVQKIGNNIWEYHEIPSGGGHRARGSHTGSTHRQEHGHTYPFMLFKAQPKSGCSCLWLKHPTIKESQPWHTVVPLTSLTVGCEFQNRRIHFQHTPSSHHIIPILNIHRTRGVVHTATQCRRACQWLQTVPW